NSFSIQIIAGPLRPMRQVPSLPPGGTASEQGDRLGKQSESGQSEAGAAAERSGTGRYGSGKAANAERPEPSGTGRRAAGWSATESRSAEQPCPAAAAKRIKVGERAGRGGFPRPGAHILGNENKDADRSSNHASHRLGGGIRGVPRRLVRDSPAADRGGHLVRAASVPGAKRRNITLA